MLVFQDLYRYYSRLEVTSPEDRPLAIAVLEKRLIQSLGVRGGYGIVDDGVNGDGDFSGGGSMLRRSLLWCRGSDEASLERITWEDGAPSPSWSWMAYQGGIDYLEMPFESIQWAYRDIKSPWSDAAKGTWSSGSDPGAGRTELKVIVRKIKLVTWVDEHSYVKFDSPAKASKSGMGLGCVILGRLRSGYRVQSRTHCVMLVTPISSVPGHRRGPCYERVGVGYLCSDLIELGEPGTHARIY